MAETNETTAPSIGAVPGVELARYPNGGRQWRIKAVAEDTSEAALIATKDAAVKVDGELAARYDH